MFTAEVSFGMFLIQKLFPTDRGENTSDSGHGRQDVSLREGFRVSRSSVSRTAQGLPLPCCLRSLRQHWSHHGVPGETSGWLKIVVARASTKSNRPLASVGLSLPTNWWPFQKVSRWLKVTTAQGSHAQRLALLPRLTTRSNYRTVHKHNNVDIFPLLQLSCWTLLFMRPGMLFNSDSGWT